jgi:hypothetical protein
LFEVVGQHPTCPQLNDLMCRAGGFPIPGSRGATGEAASCDSNLVGQPHRPGTCCSGPAKTWALGLLQHEGSSFFARGVVGAPYSALPTAPKPPHSPSIVAHLPPKRQLPPVACSCLRRRLA